MLFTQLIDYRDEAWITTEAVKFDLDQVAYDPEWLANMFDRCLGEGLIRLATQEEIWGEGNIPPQEPQQEQESPQGPPVAVIVDHGYSDVAGLPEPILSLYKRISQVYNLNPLLYTDPYCVPRGIKAQLTRKENKLTELILEAGLSLPGTLAKLANSDPYLWS